MDTIDAVLKAVGTVVVAGGGLGLIVYGIFKHLAVKWLDNQFDARLQALKHQYDKELERLRFRIASLLDRATKLHTKEFEALPEAWSKLNDAYWASRATVRLLKEFPDIDKMPSAQQREFIGKCTLHDWEKEELKNTERKTEYYQRHIAGHELYEAKTKSRDAHIFLLKNGIFFSEHIHEEMQKLDALIWSAIVEHEINIEENVRPMMREIIKALTEVGEPLLKNIQALVRERIWPPEIVCSNPDVPPSSGAPAS